VLADGWSLAESVSLVTAAAVEAALERGEAAMLPLDRVEPKLDGAGAADVRMWLKPIGMKIAPSMGEEVCRTWLSAVVMALSDFPASAVAAAARSAIRIPMQYLNEVDGHVRIEAEKEMQRRRTALRRLRLMLDEIMRASAPEQPLLQAPEDGATPLSPAELRALPAHLRRLGLNAGWVTQEELDAADGAAAGEAVNKYGSKEAGNG
jgi:hypothetical protein